MASVIRRRGSKIWTAFFRDQHKRLQGRSTGETDHKKALEIAEQYEEASRKARTLKQIIRVIGDMHRLTGGADELASLTVRKHVEQWLKAKQKERKKARHEARSEAVSKIARRRDSWPLLKSRYPAADTDSWMAWAQLELGDDLPLRFDQYAKFKRDR